MAQDAASTGHDHTGPRFDHLAEIATATALVVGAARETPDAPVPACPGWDATALCAHLGQVQRWATTVLVGRLMERPPSGSFEHAPTDPHLVADWTAAGVDPLLAALRDVGDDTPVWNFADQPAIAAFWWRRMTHEAWVHAADAAGAIGRVAAIPAPVAVDTVHEFLGLLPARRLAATPGVSIGGSLHLHATDEEVVGEWMIGLTNGVLTVTHGHAKGDAAVRAPASDLALCMWGRRDALTDEAFEVFGDREVVAAWQAIGAF